MKIKPLNLLNYDYACEFVDLDKIAQLPFSENYEQLLKWRKEWIIKLEINLSKLEDEKARISHLESVKEVIQYELKPKNRQDLIDPYLEYYDLEIEKFPFFDNSKIKSILSKTYFDESEYVIDRFQDQIKDVISMKSNFFDYAFNLEVLRIIHLIDDYLPGIGVFQSNVAEKIFNDLLNFLNIEDEIKRGDQAKLAGIWKSQKARKVIFKKATLKNEYLKYINKRFGKNYKTKSFSAGDNHELFVDDWISQHYLSSL